MCPLLEYQAAPLESMAASSEALDCNIMPRALLERNQESLRYEITLAGKADWALFDCRVTPYRARIRGFLRRHVDAESAEDITQEVMVAAFRHLNVIEDLQAIERWLFCTAARHVVNFHRARARCVPAVSLSLLRDETRIAALSLFHGLYAAGDYAGEVAARAGQGEERLERVEERLWVQKLLEQARQACSEVQWSVLRRYYEGASLEEVSQQLGIDSATVRSHFRRGRGQLLSHIFIHTPELVGMRDEIMAVIAWLDSESAGEEGLTGLEKQALRNPRKHIKCFRAVCLKIARHLPLPL